MIDTLKTVDTLKAHGFDEYKARGIATVITGSNDNLATKDDINAVKSDINALRLATKNDINAVKININTLRWMIGVSLVLNTVSISGIIAILIFIAR